ncbi:ATP-binding protein [Bacillus sp. 165]|uniref:ATP-binding protein n=1 Tax=Bacillus sp. 165 TaxID=1529117 RepID=UPI001ADB7BAB|nr:ATP-binding protein [Bacillus sp. 165]MBO9128439.1 GHKL domain-containing protein [Bacillus sp. 165]
MLIYHLFWMRKGNRHPKLNTFVFLCLSLFTSIMCLTFAAEPTPGYRFDLRQIILIVATLTKGPLVGGIIFFIMNAYRLTLGGDGAILALASSSVLYILLVMARSFVLKASNSRIMVIAVLASVFYTVSWVPIFLMNIEQPYEYILHIIVYQLCSTFGTMLVLYLMMVLQSQAKLQEELINIEKFHLIGEMAASISHEIRNPLTSTRGFLQLLKSGAFSESERNTYLDIAMDGIDQANHVLTDYLTFAKPSIKKFQHLDIKKELQSSISLMIPLANFSNVTIQYEMPESTFLIWGEKQKLNQCFLNIMKNSIEAMPKEGTLKISIERVNQNVIVHIEDTGIGMSEEQLKQLGSPFYSTKDKGTGLGMTVVFSVLKSMGGTIQIASERNVGTKFALAFPLSKPDKAKT